MSIGLALADAASNCARYGATATLTLRSGVRITGELKRENSTYGITVRLRKPDGGWATVDTDEIVAVEVSP